MKTGEREGVYSYLFFRLARAEPTAAAREVEGEGLEGEPEMRGGDSGVRAPQHPGIAFLLSSLPITPPSPYPRPHQYRQEAEVMTA